MQFQRVFLYAAALLYLGCNPVQQRPPAAQILLHPQAAPIESITAGIAGYIKAGDTSRIRVAFRAANRVPASLKSKIEWNIRLADSLPLSGMDHLRIEMYDSAYRQSLTAGSQTNPADTRKCCLKKALLWQRNRNLNLALNEYERYFAVVPTLRVLESRNDMFAANYLGEMYVRIGDNQKSFSYFDRSFAFNQKLPDSVRWFAPYLAFANALNQAKKPDSALLIAKQGLGLPTLKPLERIYLKSVLSDALLAIKNFADAEKTCAGALEELAHLPDPNDEDAFLIRQGYGAILQASGKFDAALHQFSLALQEGLNSNEGSDKSREFSKLYRALGECFQNAGKPDSAIRYFNRALASIVPVDTANVYALPKKEAVFGENALQEALDSEADWWLRSKKSDGLEHALSAFELAMLTDDALQKQFSFDPDKLDYQQQKKKRSSRAIEICAQLFEKTGEEGWIRKAWGFSEASKAAVLRDDIRKQMAYRQIKDDSLLQQIKVVENEMSDLKTAMFVAADRPAELQLLQQEHAAVTDRYISLTTSLKLNHPALGNSTFGQLSGEFMKNALFNQLPVLEFFAADSGRYFIFLKDPAGRLQFRRIILPDAVLLKWIGRFRSADSLDNHFTDYRDEAFYLYRQLLGGISSITNYPNLLIIPDGQLCYMPWEALLTSNSSANNWKDLPFLVKSTAITLGFSLESLVQQNGRHQEATGSALLAFAPGFRDHQRGLQPLLASLKELEAIKESFPGGRFFNGQEATLLNFRKACPEAAMIHLSTHASADMEGGACKIEFADGSLYLHELSLQPLKAEAVVLSACETGLGRFENGEGVFSMARSFYDAGAKNVITSLWKIDDERTANLFSKFYHENGQPFEMLHKAKLKYLQHHGGTYASPFYWAAFANTGYSNTNKPVTHATAIALATFAFLVIVLAASIFVNSGFRGNTKKSRPLLDSSLKYKVVKEGW